MRYPRSRWTICISALEIVWLVIPNLVSAQEILLFKNEYVIERKVQPTKTGARTQAARVQDTSVELVERDSIGVVRQKTSDKRVVKRAAEELNRCAELQRLDPTIVSCSPNYVRKPLLNPNDTYFNAQRYLHDVTLSEQGAYASRGSSAWNISTGSRSVIAAVLDTGIDLQHPDLAKNIFTNPNEIGGNGIDDDNNGYIDDVHGANTAYRSGNPSDIGGALTPTFAGHGTHVSGIIGAEGNNGRGVTGVNWEVSLLPVGIYRENVEDGSSFDVIRGFDYVTDLKVNRGIDVTVINASFGGPGYSEAEFAAIRRARDAGIVVVCAAGNDGANNEFSPIFPASYELDNIIAVGAADGQGELAEFSNYGATSVDVLAPGTDILSTVPGGGYDYKQGTSMAAPFVTGAVALLKSARPSLSYLELRSAVIQSAFQRNTISAKLVVGGLLDLQGLLELTDINTAPTPIVSQQPGDFRLRAKRLAGKKNRLSLRVTRKDAGALVSPADLYIGLYLDGRLCEQGASLRDSLYKVVSLRGDFGSKGRGPGSALFYIYNGQGLVTDEATVLVDSSTRSKKLRSKAATQRLCNRFVDSLKVVRTR